MVEYSITTEGIPKGGIILWSGAIVNIPSGWALCDGNNGTPNLKDKFVVGAGATYAVNDAGGNYDHTHYVNGWSNQANDILAIANPYVSAGGDYDQYTQGHVHGVQIVSESASSLPPFYALAMIMKL